GDVAAPDTDVQGKASVVTPRPKATRKPRARRQSAPVREAVAESVAEPVAAPAAVSEPVSTTLARARRAPVRRAAQTDVPVLSGHRYVVKFQVVRLIRATSVLDALRLAEAMGAADVLAITRAD